MITSVPENLFPASSFNEPVQPLDGFNNNPPPWTVTVPPDQQYDDLNQHPTHMMPTHDFPARGDGQTQDLPFGSYSESAHHDTDFRELHPHDFSHETHDACGPGPHATWDYSRHNPPVPIRHPMGPCEAYDYHHHPTRGYVPPFHPGPPVDHGYRQPGFREGYPPARSYRPRAPYPGPQSSVERFSHPADHQPFYRPPEHANFPERYPRPHPEPSHLEVPHFEPDGEHFQSNGDQDYRVPPHHTEPVDEGYYDVDIRMQPAVRSNTTEAKPAGLFPSAFAAASSRPTLDRPIGSCLPRPKLSPHGTMPRLPVPEHLLSAFEEAAVSTGAWPPKGLEHDQGDGTKKRALPAWLRDELEKLEKKKAKEMAAVAGDTVLGAAPDAERDAEGDIVMEEETGTGRVASAKPLVNDEASDEEQDTFEESSALLSPKSVVTQSPSEAPTEAVSLQHAPSSLGAQRVTILESSRDADAKSGVVPLNPPNASGFLTGNSATPDTLAPLTPNEFRKVFGALSEEDQQAETTRFITRTLTDALLAVSGELILAVAEDALSSARKEEERSRKSSHEPTPFVEMTAEAPSGLMGLVAYNSESESDTEHTGPRSAKPEERRENGEELIEKSGKVLPGTNGAREGGQEQRYSSGDSSSSSEPEADGNVPSPSVRSDKRKLSGTYEDLASSPVRTKDRRKHQERRSRSHHRSRKLDQSSSPLAMHHGSRLVKKHRKHSRDSVKKSKKHRRSRDSSSSDTDSDSPARSSRNSRRAKHRKKHTHRHSSRDSSRRSRKSHRTHSSERSRRRDKP
ncbi:hypothetical protein CSKR_104529 [Clonorchis sinensis]|uniref:Myo inositol monophosphatase n=1 Tax=Clonorchis sinensis TaxID=79923 RepID=A0A8T1M5T3_CLOSI|nr:hypothetical protein CSKR_104529 [Clonorchis sinensis]